MPRSAASSIDHDLGHFTALKRSCMMTGTRWKKTQRLPYHAAPKYDTQQNVFSFLSRPQPAWLQSKAEIESAEAYSFPAQQPSTNTGRYSRRAEISARLITLRRQSGRNTERSTLRSPTAMAAARRDFILCLRRTAGRRESSAYCLLTYTYCPASGSTPSRSTRGGFSAAPSRLRREDREGTEVPWQGCLPQTDEVIRSAVVREVGYEGGE